MEQISPLIAQLDRRFKSLQSTRSNWERHWQELADYMLPVSTKKGELNFYRTRTRDRLDHVNNVENNPLC